MNKQLWETQGPFRAWVVQRHSKSLASDGFDSKYTLAEGDILALPSVATFERPVQYIPDLEAVESPAEQYAAFQIQEETWWNNMEARWLLIEPDVVSETRDRLLELLLEAVSQVAVALDGIPDQEAFEKCLQEGIDDENIPQNRIKALISCLESPYAIFLCRMY